ncbi:Hypothetical predicted protein [Mytilus galloprovincialis]|uniref:BTB domain-containing protein n=1 Tax=Mytilus galloprovincialis TaxID=29158 RepID=A0A8B6CW09_MYTGA|nr:Hypothetical predicted protein [Mytilus galloprovincialis]
MGYEKGTTAKRQTVSLIIEGEKLCAYREELMTVSPVFRKMLSSQFKETYSGEIEFPGKNMLQFKCFMECLQRGPSSNVTDENVHYILPLAHEYQTDALLSEIDSLLALISVQDEHKMSPSDVIDNIVEAEMYGLKRYLDINIDIASKERYIPALLEPGFKFISNHSKSIMSEKHWDYKDKTYHKLHLISV